VLYHVTRHFTRLGTTVLLSQDSRGECGYPPFAYPLTRSEAAKGGLGVRNSTTPVNGRSLRFSELSTPAQSDRHSCALDRQTVAIVDYRTNDWRAASNYSLR
jgi:hypothetical protein